LLFDDLGQPSFLHVERNVIDKFLCRQGPRTLRIEEHIGEIVLHDIHQAERISVFFFRLGTKTGYHIGRNPAFLAKNFPDGAHPVEVPFPVIGTVHQFQNPGVPALHGEVDVFADVVVTLHRVEDFIGNVFGVGSRKAYP
jgi:hypothetical protein